jgi:hypothetical protein
MAKPRKLLYYARTGGTKKKPALCGDHEHDSVEMAAACLPGPAYRNEWEVYESAGGVFTATVFACEKRDGEQYIHRTDDSPVAGKRFAEV